MGTLESSTSKIDIITEELEKTDLTKYRSKEHIIIKLQSNIRGFLCRKTLFKEEKNITKKLIHKYKLTPLTNDSS